MKQADIEKARREKWQRHEGLDLVRPAERHEIGPDGEITVGRLVLAFRALRSCRRMKYGATEADLQTLISELFDDLEVELVGVGEQIDP